MTTVGVAVVVVIVVVVVVVSLRACVHLILRIRIISTLFCLNSSSYLKDDFI